MPMPIKLEQYDLIYVDLPFLGSTPQFTFTRLQRVVHECKKVVYCCKLPRDIASQIEKEGDNT
jgi:hypothetical protein